MLQLLVYPNTTQAEHITVNCAAFGESIKVHMAREGGSKLLCSNGLFVFTVMACTPPHYSAGSGFWRNRLTNCSFTYRVHLQLHSITLVCRVLILLPTWTNLTNFNFTSHTWTFLQALDSAAHMEKSYKVHDYISCLDTWNHQPKHTSSIFQINWMANICLF